MCQFSSTLCPFQQLLCPKPCLYFTEIIQKILHAAMQVEIILHIYNFGAFSSVKLHLELFFSSQ